MYSQNVFWNGEDKDGKKGSFQNNYGKIDESGVFKQKIYCFLIRFSPTRRRTMGNFSSRKISVGNFSEVYKQANQKNKRKYNKPDISRFFSCVFKNWNYKSRKQEKHHEYAATNFKKINHNKSPTNPRCPKTIFQHFLLRSALKAYSFSTYAKFSFSTYAKFSKNLLFLTPHPQASETF